MNRRSFFSGLALLAAAPWIGTRASLTRREIRSCVKLNWQPNRNWVGAYHSVSREELYRKLQKVIKFTQFQPPLER